MSVDAEECHMQMIFYLEALIDQCSSQNLVITQDMACSTIELYVDLCFMHAKSDSNLARMLIEKPQMYETIKQSIESITDAGIKAEKVSDLARVERCINEAKQQWGSQIQESVQHAY
jgi:hypothetical protein